MSTVLNENRRPIDPKIEVQSDTLRIFDWNYPNSSLLKITPRERIAEKEGNESKLILRLMTQSWANDSFLYRVARRVQELYPEAGIDWVSTFCIYEKAEFAKKKIDELSDEVRQ